jgi:transketolase
LADEGHIGPGEFNGRNMHFGIREHAMGSIANGMAVHGGAIPYTATFLIFSDYMRPAIRLGSIMEQRVVYVFTHDSIGLGEDGPTHQPIEQLMALREIPGLVVLRPADGTETAVAWQAALERRHGPTVLAFTRQNLPVLDRTVLGAAEGVGKGGYVLWEHGDTPQAILIATGSEVHIALEAGRTLESEGIASRVVSMPSWELFDEQPKEYRDRVLPPNIRARVSVEAGTTKGWERYVGLDGASVGMTTFGASAPIGVLYEEFGITAAKVADEARKLAKR